MLSDEERKIIEDSMWVVNSLLKEFGFSSDNDLRQEAALYMCKCYERFDPTRGVRWTTYAYSNLYHFILRQEKKEAIRESQQADYEVELVAGEEYEAVSDEDNVRLDAVWQVCNDRERRVAKLLEKGYKVKDIAEKIKKSRSTVYSIINSIREKATEVLKKV